MSSILAGSDFENFKLTEDSISTRRIHHNSELSRYAIPQGQLQFVQQAIGSDMFMVQAEYNISEDVQIAGKGDSCLLEIQCNLSSQDIFYRTKYSGDQQSKMQSANISFLAADDNQADIFFQEGAIYETFDIHISTHCLTKYAGESRKMDAFINEIAAGRSAMLSPTGISTQGAIYQCIQSMRGCSFDGLTRKIYLESKVYELIALLHDGAEQTASNFVLNTRDIEAIHLAAALIKQNLAQPLTILKLARDVGINQTKLKMGFKTLYQKTIFGYLQTFRMNEARRYLLDSQLPIEQIAQLVGYQNVSNFSAAFKRTQGMSPLKVRHQL